MRHIETVQNNKRKRQEIVEYSRPDHDFQNGDDRVGNKKRKPPTFGPGLLDEFEKKGLIPDSKTSERNKNVGTASYPSTSIPLPLNYVPEDAEQANLTYLDNEFSDLMDKICSRSSSISKICQKRILVNTDHYVIAYSWKFTPQFYLSLKTLSEFMNTHHQVRDIKFNPTGGSCSKESNVIFGIATVCYCDSCAYLVGISTTVPTVISPEGSYGRCLLLVDKVTNKKVMDQHVAQ